VSMEYLPWGSGLTGNRAAAICNMVAGATWRPPRVLVSTDGPCYYLKQSRAMEEPYAFQLITRRR